MNTKTEPIETQKAGTPGATWRAEGKEDPHGDRYNCERAELCLGSFTDDELANYAFMNYDVRPSVQDLISGNGHSPIAIMTAVKDRIRWLSRKLEEAVAYNATRTDELMAAAAVHGGEAVGYFQNLGSSISQVSDEYKDEPDVFPLYTTPQPAIAVKADNKVLLDARRYRRLQILGAAPFGSDNLFAGTVLRFQGLDAFLDADLKSQSSRGEAQPIDASIHEIVALQATSPSAPIAEGDEQVGLPVTQEPKYTTDGHSIINRASGEAIPHDEPVFIFRARDRHAIMVLDEYCDRLGIYSDEEKNAHRKAVIQRIKDFSAFAKQHPDRMKEPDTAAPVDSVEERL